MPDSFCAEALARDWHPSLQTATASLIARFRGGSPVLTSILEKAGLVYDDIVLYQVEGRQVSEQRQAEEGFDYITFASASGVRAYLSSGLNINPGQRDRTDQAGMHRGHNGRGVKKHGIKGRYHCRNIPIYRGWCRPLQMTPYPAKLNGSTSRITC